MASQMETLTRFGSVLLPLRLLFLLNLRDGPEFAALTKKNLSTWRRCLAWHGWWPDFVAERGELLWSLATEVADND